MSTEKHGAERVPLQRLVSLADGITRIDMPEESQTAAINSAHWRTCSPHEWQWTPVEQANMALYVLWAAQRLAVVNSVSAGAAWSEANRGFSNADGYQPQQPESRSDG